MVSALVHFSLLLLCFIFIPVNSQIEVPITSNDELTLAETASHLVREYFQNSVTVIVIEKSFHPELRNTNKRIFDYILQNLNETITIQLFYGKTDDQPWEYHILIVDSEQAFLNIISNFPQNNFDGEFRFLIVLTNYSATHYFRTIQGIFRACKENNFINVNILLNHHFLGVCMYKYNIFTEAKCHVAQPYLYFRLIDGYEKLIDIFPQILLNFHKCPLRVCGVQNYPMLTFLGNLSDPKPDDKYWTNLRGIDGQLIRILSRSLNFTIDLLPFSKERTYIENHTGFGCYAKLLNNTADIAIGGLSGSDPKRIALTPSILYHHSPIVFIVRGKKELDCANRLGRPFSVPVWQSIIGLLLAGAFLIQILRILKQSYRKLVVGEQSDATPLLNFLAVFLGYPVTRDPKGNLARYLLILWLMMTLIIRSAYQGSLYDSIRIDRFQKIPQKYEELFTRNYKFLISKFYRDLNVFPRNQTIILDQKHYERLKLLATLEGNYATVALRDHVVSYLETHFRKGSDLRIINEQLYQYQTAMYFQKHSIFATPFNYNIQQFSFAGIITHIFRNNTKDRRIFRDNMMGAPLRLSNDRIWSLYQVFVWLMALTMGVFILELLSAYIVRVRVILNWFH